MMHKVAGGVEDDALPYRDTKPQGAADFYFAINATFRFIIEKRGVATWIRFVRDMATEYYRPVWRDWQKGGLKAVAVYLQQAFQAEPGAVFEVEQGVDCVTLHVRVCPAIRHLRSGNRKIVGEFCQHCYFQYSTMAGHAGLHMDLQGGNGACRQRFSASPLAQNLGKISAVQ